MAGKAVIIVGVVNDGITVGSGATAVADQFRVNGTGMVLLNQSAQTGAVIASVTSVTKLAGPYVPIVSMPANIVAGTITFLKIGIDIRDGAEIKVGDVISLVGNVAGVIAIMAILGGAAPALVAGLAIVTIITGVASIVGSEIIKKITTNAAGFFNDNPMDSYLDYACAPDMQIVHRNTLRDAYANQMLSCQWISETGELQAAPIAFPDEGLGVIRDAGGEGAGIEVEVEEAEVEVEAEPHGSNGGGIGSSFYPPTVPVIPAPLPEIIPVVTIGPLDFGGGVDNSNDNGDEYGCCSSGSDGYI
ncbi:hypothetical protein [Pseudomonas sp. PD9R]|uniref:hypothetical protein n=1 Tax=Pseudomonas sp. PD9R TaxID=2853534 RepID=UPI001C49090F|nr:hypothetical protein [Pseudomonas sp. PD9R]MBV6827265.1 hypothetical protein [Pseudomonas sp. PD9R]